MINYLYSFKNTNMKNINLFYRMLKNNHNSLMEITLKKKKNKKPSYNQFFEVKEMILNQLKINNQFKNYVRSQTEFIDKYEIKFVIISSKISVPKEILNLSKKIITDENTKEKFILL